MPTPECLIQQPNIFSKEQLKEYFVCIRPLTNKVSIYPSMTDRL